MQRQWHNAVMAVAVCIIASGCAGISGGVTAGLEDVDDTIELTEVPFFPQVTDQCGPAALAMILNASGVGADPEALKSRIYIPGREGSLQLELLAATRAYDRLAYSIDPDLQALVAELRAGRPVLVLQNLGIGLAPVWHYAVVVGYLPEDRRFVLRSGDQRRYLIDARRFVRTWHRAENWGVVALRPDELPAQPDPQRYLRSVAALESVGATSVARSGYRAAVEQWPLNGLAWLGLGNASYAEGDLDIARLAYQAMLDLEPGNLIALNNIAQVKAEQGCIREARDAIDQAFSILAPGDPMHQHLRQTRREIEARPLADTRACRMAL
jgi:tetratricopeptide (TPR) repeat protein